MTTVMRIFKQWLANRGATIEIKGYVEGALVINDLKRIETKLTARIDALEQYVDDVMERYLRKISARENRAAQKEEKVPVVPTDMFETIRQKQGGGK